MTRGIRLIAFTKAPDSTNYTGIESFDGFETRFQLKGITYRNKWLPHLWILFQNCTPHNIHVCPLTGMNTKIAKINSILAPKRPRALKCSPATGFFSFFSTNISPIKVMFSWKSFFDKLFSQLENFLSNFSSPNHNCRSHTALAGYKVIFSLLY